METGTETDTGGRVPENALTLFVPARVPKCSDTFCPAPRQGMIDTRRPWIHLAGSRRCPTLENGFPMNAIRPAAVHDRPGIEAVARALPEWFTDKGIVSIQRDVQFQKALVAVHDEQVVGFVTYYCNQGIGHIGWMGVLPLLHGRGIGKALIDSMCAELRRAGVDEVSVSTLGDSVDYPPYARTRAFYRAVGFHDVERVQHPDNPECIEELILRMKIRVP